jgi:hypothetical protein
MTQYTTSSPCDEIKNIERVSFGSKRDSFVVVSGGEKAKREICHQ